MSQKIEAESTQAEMPFVQHLDVLRGHLMRIIIAIFAGGIVVFLCKSFVFDVIIFGPQQLDFPTYRVLCSLGENLSLGTALCIDKISYTLQNVEMAGQFLLHIKVSIIIGFIIAFPYIIWEIWKFVQPALHTQETKYAKWLAAMISLLFFIGVAFGYYIIAPFSLNFLGSYTISETVNNQITLASYVSTVTMLVLSAGLIFELPMLVYFLAKIGILTAEFMREYRKYAAIGILVLSAIITPPDVTSQLLITFPLYLLYEISIFIAQSVNPQTENQ